MKKVLTLVAVIVTLLGSCKKYEPSKPLDLNDFRKVTYSVGVFAELDETNSVLEPAPDNSNLVTLTVPYSAYNAQNTSGGLHVIRAKEVKLEQTADSKSYMRVYYFEVPVTANGIIATINFEDFTYDVKKRDSYTGLERTEFTRFTLSSEPTARLYESGNDQRSIQHVYKVKTINDNDLHTFTPTHTVSISGKIEYQSNDTMWKAVPSNTEIVAVITLTDGIGRTYTESQKVTINSGTYSMSVPMVANGYANIDLRAENFWTYTSIYTNKSAIYQYVLNTTIGGIYNYPNQANKNAQYARMNYVQDE